LLGSVPVILLARPLALATTLGALALLFAGMEAFARRRLLSFMASAALMLVVGAAFVAIVELSQRYWAVAISAIFGIAALALLVGNLGDIRHGWQRGGSMGEQTGEPAVGERDQQSP
jgi:hypothetical protein